MNVVGIASRTSSPVFIHRDDLLEHSEVFGLFPCGEGGGYARGIISATMDGERNAEAAVVTANAYLTELQQISNHVFALAGL